MVTKASRQGGLTPAGIAVGEVGISEEGLELVAEPAAGMAVG